MFKKILIANRGEIACRVMRTAQRLGIRCVAIYSEADVNALHVKLADEAYCIGPPPARESYLRADKIIAVALATGAEAIHPGYGFLSENAEFATACTKANICFIGPPAAAILAMGSKSTAKKIMETAGVPLIPGYHGDDQSLETLTTAAEKIGYPVLLKAAAGGGGKGMRVVWQGHGFATALAAAQREAQASFGNSQILIEKYLTKPRHIEMQIFADNHGNVIHLFERDCSIQRRHQKIIEEAPAPNISADLRQRIGAAAVTATRAIQYAGAGTIEFLLDTDDSFYFMEMNTRLQVEHPVTEMITQQDLVEWQLRVALGEKLPATQIKIHGHALETRIYAEDPDNEFLPSVGQIRYLKTPTVNAQVRIDSGIEQGDAITPYYDPMITKLITWGNSRDEALQHLTSALAAYQIVGVTTNLNLLARIATHPAFVNGELDTDFIQNHHQELFAEQPISPIIFCLASCYFLQLQKNKLQPSALDNTDPYSPWNITDSWHLNLPAKQTFQFEPDHVVQAEVLHATNQYQLTCANERFVVNNIVLHDHDVIVTFDKVVLKANIFTEKNQVYLLHAGKRYHLALYSPNENHAHDTTLRSNLTAPMPGKMVAILAAAGTEVAAGAGLAIVEAMKMEHTLHAPSKGIVKEWYFNVGDLVDEGIELLKFEELT